MEPKFKLGDTIYYASCNWIKKNAMCPDCMGKKYLTIIMGDNSQHTIQCEQCKSGWKAATGLVDSYDYSPSVTMATITKIEYSDKEIMYWAKCQGYYAERCFSTYQEAMEHAEKLTQERIQESNKPKKYDHSKEWSWNVTYYRKEIRECKRKIEYAEKQLSYANQQAKKEK